MCTNNLISLVFLLFLRIKMAFEETMFLVFVITMFHVAVMAKQSMKSGGKF